MKIFNSATKIVFVMTAMTVCLGFFLGKVTEQAFLSLVTMVFAFYYSKGKEIDQPIDSGIPQAA